MRKFIKDIAGVVAGQNQPYGQPGYGQPQYGQPGQPAQPGVQQPGPYAGISSSTISATLFQPQNIPAMQQQQQMQQQQAYHQVATQFGQYTNGYMPQPVGVYDQQQQHHQAMMQQQLEYHQQQEYQQQQHQQQILLYQQQQQQQQQQLQQQQLHQQHHQQHQQQQPFFPQQENPQAVFYPPQAQQAQQPQQPLQSPPIAQDRIHNFVLAQQQHQQQQFQDQFQGQLHVQHPAFGNAAPAAPQPVGAAAGAGAGTAAGATQQGPLPHSPPPAYEPPGPHNGNQQQQQQQQPPIENIPPMGLSTYEQFVRSAQPGAPAEQPAAAASPAAPVSRRYSFVADSAAIEPEAKFRLAQEQLGAAAAAADLPPSQRTSGLSVPASSLSVPGSNHSSANSHPSDPGSATNTTPARPYQVPQADPNPSYPAGQPVYQASPMAPLRNAASPLPPQSQPAGALSPTNLQQPPPAAQPASFEPSNYTSPLLPRPLQFAQTASTTTTKEQAVPAEPRYEDAPILGSPAAAQVDESVQSVLAKNLGSTELSPGDSVASYGSYPSPSYFRFSSPTTSQHAHSKANSPRSHESAPPDFLITNGSPTEAPPAPPVPTAPINKAIAKHTAPLNRGWNSSLTAGDVVESPVGGYDDPVYKNLSVVQRFQFQFTQNQKRDLPSSARISTSQSDADLSKDESLLSSASVSTAASSFLPSASARNSQSSTLSKERANSIPMELDPKSAPEVVSFDGNDDLVSRMAGLAVNTGLGSGTYSGDHSASSSALTSATSPHPRTEKKQRHRPPAIYVGPIRGSPAETRRTSLTESTHSDHVFPPPPAITAIPLNNGAGPMGHPNNTVNFPPPPMPPPRQEPQYHYPAPPVTAQRVPSPPTAHGKQPLQPAQFTATSNTYFPPPGGQNTRSRGASSNSPGIVYPAPPKPSMSPAPAQPQSAFIASQLHTQARTPAIGGSAQSPKYVSYSPVGHVGGSPGTSFSPYSLSMDSLVKQRQ